MQREISNEVKIGDSVTTFQSTGKAPGVDKTASDFDNANLKVKKDSRLIERGIYNADNGRCIPRMLDLVFQRMIAKIMTIEQPPDATYMDKEVLDLELILDNNYYTNLKSLHLCFPIRFRKLSNAAQSLDLALFSVNNFFAHWVMEIDIPAYGTKKCVILTTTPQEIYRYSDTMLKRLEKTS